MRKYSTGKKRKGGGLRIPSSPIPKPKKILTRGLYEAISPKSKKRDYGERLKKI